MHIEIMLPAIIAVVTGCAGRHETPLTPSPADPSASESAGAGSTNAVKATVAKPAASRIVIDESIRSACGITAEDAHFDFDSSVVKVGDRDVLAALATCLSSGPLAGRQLMLVGHADGRGTEAYNQTLGEQRADSVSRYLSDRGMNAEHLSTTSRGEAEATGTEEVSWALDRRVDVTLQD